jgi:alkylation response protein AidB-like acyl-CoA dehydrogenase
VRPQDKGGGRRLDAQFSEQQEQLRASVREFLGSECPMDLVRAQMDDPVGHPEALWKQMAELGWIGLIVDERYGGSGLDEIDLALVLEETGRVLLPGPYVSTAVVGARLLELAGSDDQKARLLPKLAAGELRIALAQIEDAASWGPEGIRLRAEGSADGFRLNGRKLFVQDAACADLLIVAVRTADAADDPSLGITLLLVEATAEGVEQRPIAYNEQTRKLAQIRFDDVQVPAGELLGEPDGAWPVLAEVLDIARAAQAAELCGAAERVLEMSVAYAKQREQFGRPIGTFQALQHRCAEMFVKVEAIRSAAHYAAWSQANGEPDRHTTACLAKAYASEAYTQVAASGIQIHGGLGFTWEQDLHLYFKHAKAAEFAFGTPSHCRELAARALIDV